MNKAFCYLRSFRPFCLFVLLAVIISSCQREDSIELGAPPTQALKDTIASVVVDGDYGGLAFSDYDSMVLRYTAGLVTINHYTSNRMLIATELIQYDGSNRVVTYKTIEPSSGPILSRKFTYTGTENIPSVIDDTSFTLSNDIQISKVRITGRSSANSNTVMNLSTAFQYVANPAFNGTVTGSSTFDNGGRLLSYTDIGGYASKYYYNAAGDVDSCMNLTLSGDNLYSRLWYTGEQNPLKEFAQFVYKNLGAYGVTDNLNSSYYEIFLKIGNLPSELYGARVPSRTAYGFDPTLMEAENTFKYTIDNKVLKQIIVNHKDLVGGDVSQTHIRFHRL
jgi:hypothetical protein